MGQKSKLVSWDADFYKTLSSEPCYISLSEQQRYIVGQILERITWQTRWDGDLSGMDLYGIAGEIEAEIAGGCEQSEEFELSCFDLTPDSVAFTFYPNDPYLDPDNDNGNIVVSQLRWDRLGRIGLSNIPYVGDAIANLAETWTGYFETDIFLAPDLFEFWQSPIARIGDIITALTSFWFPYFTLKVSGDVEVEFELLKVPFGGAALIIPDLDLSLSALADTVLEFLDDDGTIPASWIVTELDRDIIAIPPELDVLEIQRVNFDETGDHTIHVVFLPRLNDEIPFLGVFGGIRSVQICGGTALEPETDTIIDKRNYGDDFFVKDGVIMTTITDICEGVICAFEKSASRFLSGQAGNTIGGITIGTDGQIVVSSAGGGSAGGTAQEQKSGGTFKAANELNIMFGKIQDWICVTAVGTATTKLYFKSLYATIGATEADTFIDNVVAYLGACGGAVWYEVLIDEFAEAMFCGGVNKAALSAAIIEHGSDANKIDLMLEAIAILTDTQLTTWYSAGLEIPLDEYLAYACYLRDDVTLDYQASDYTDQVSRTVAPNGWSFDHYRAVRITVTGKFTSIATAGKEQDLFWYKADENTDPVLANDVQYFRTSSSAPVKNLYPANVPAYKADGNYSFTVVVPPNAFGNYIQLYWITANKITDAQGSLDLLFEDLGEVV